MPQIFPDVPVSLNTSEYNLNSALYEPCLLWADRYDRGVGYFTSGWITQTSIGMSDFASRGGKARWIASPIIQQQDYEILNSNPSEDTLSFFRNLLLGEIETLIAEMEENTLNAFAWMLYDGIIEMRFAVPDAKLEGGDFHDKFGIFYSAMDALSFSGSINDSVKGFSNYESIKVFKSWQGMDDYIQPDIKRFNKLWNNLDPNVRVYDLGNAIRQKIFSIRKPTRPYNKILSGNTSKWRHQAEAKAIFMEKHNGVFEMATGTGKTRTAITIIKELFQQDEIKRVIITTHGNDLLKQWLVELYKLIDDIPVFQYFEGKKELPSFLLAREKAILLVGRDPKSLASCLDKLERKVHSPFPNTMFLFDEVHGMGSEKIVETLSGRFSKYKYRLGLSATPDRKYDSQGNQFIEQEIGPVIFSFSLEDAIKRGILCEFNYIPIYYSLTDEEKVKKKEIIATHNYLMKEGKAPSEKDFYTKLANVNKLSVSKIPLFNDYVNAHPEILNRCIIFVESKDYGELVQERLIHYMQDYHTYYGDDDEKNLASFANGNLSCLVTCKKISEGIDIQSVNSIVLFASDRSNLVTTQRIGRSLRINPDDPNKKASVLDFIHERNHPNEHDDELSGDEERMEWLSNLSKIKREF